MAYDTEIFFKKTCRLCETNEHHTASESGTAASCTYWLDRRYDEAPHIRGYVAIGGDAREFWLPVFHCPWCGREIV